MVITLSKVKMMQGIWKARGAPGLSFVTKNYTPGLNVYGERLFEIEGEEYREWQHRKSKLAAGILNNVFVPALQPGMRVLYLGAASGTTVSHVSDIAGKDGLVYAVEFSPRPSRDLFRLADQRDNIVPILADARYPQQYTHIVDYADFLFCDVAQPTQSNLFLDNAQAFLKSGGQGFIAIKTRSISQKGKPQSIFEKQEKILEKNGFNKVKSVSISKIHRDHFVFLGNW